MGATQIQQVTHWAATIKLAMNKSGVFIDETKMFRINEFCQKHLGPHGDRWQVSVEDQCLVFRIKYSQDAVWMQLHV